MSTTCIRFLINPDDEGPGDRSKSSAPLSGPTPHHPHPAFISPTGSTRIGSFEILGELGRGTSGTVFKARHAHHHTEVALKLFRPAIAHPAQIRRLFREIRIARRLNHPHIAPVHDLQDHNGQPYLVMRLFEGGNLFQLLHTNRPAPRRAARIVEILSGAVHHAHLEGVFHRDLKPSNVLLDQCGNPHVGDFGVAKDAQPEMDPPLTLDGEILGTPNYMAPEQAQPRHEDIGPWSDVYSLGAILYELLTGRPPFVGSSITEILNKVAHQEPVAPTELDPSIPAALETICLKCLSKSPARRYLSALALQWELRRFQEHIPILATPPPKPWQNTLWI